MIGREQRYHPGYSLPERMFISMLGIPVIGLRIRARNLLRLLPGISGGVDILDAGSGPGVITFLLATKYPNARITGIDISSEEVNNCKTIAVKGNFGNTSFEQLNISEIPWQSRFELVVCVDILEHIEDDQSAIDSLCRTLVPGGILILHVPAKYRRYPVFKKTLNFSVPSHVREGYNLDHLQILVKKTGLQIMDAGHTFGFMETLANNLGYMITKAEKRNRILYALAFPFLNAMGWLGQRSHAGQLGAGVYVIAQKPDEHLINGLAASPSSLE